MFLYVSFNKIAQKYTLKISKRNQNSILVALEEKTIFKDFYEIINENIDVGFVEFSKYTFEIH